MNNRHRHLCTVLVSFTASLCVADGWTRFRGPNGSGISTATTIPVTWTSKDFTWRVTLPEGGHSSPVIWGEKIFLTCCEKESATRIIVCLQRTDGKILWQRKYPSQAHRINGDNSYAASSAAVDGNHVYLYWTTPEEVTVLALNHDGKDVWRRNLGPYASSHGSGTSPIVYKDLVVVPNDQKGKSSLIALDCTTGKTRWKTERRSTRAAYSTPCVYKPKGGPPELIFTCTSHGVTSIDPTTGAVNWELTDAFPQRVVSSPVVADGLIVGTSGQGGRGRQFVAVRPGSKEKGLEPELVWELKRTIPYVPTALAKDGLLYLLTDDGVARCFRTATGKPVWEERLGAKFYGSFVWAQGRLYAISRGGEVFVLKAGEKYELLARNDLGEPSQATPAIVDGVMYLRTHSHLMALGGKK